MWWCFPRLQCLNKHRPKRSDQKQEAKLEALHGKFRLSKHCVFYSLRFVSHNTTCSDEWLDNEWISIFKSAPPLMYDWRQNCPYREKCISVFSLLFQVGCSVVKIVAIRGHLFPLLSDVGTVKKSDKENLLFRKSLFLLIWLLTCVMVSKSSCVDLGPQKPNLPVWRTLKTNLYETINGFLCVSTPCVLFHMSDAINFKSPVDKVSLDV